MGQQGHIELLLSWGENLESAVTKLLQCKEEGKLRYVDFNGTNLYSDTIDLDKAYLQIHGKTKAEFDKSMEDFQLKLEADHDDFIARLPELEAYWFKKGKEVLPEGNWVAWESRAQTSLRGLHKGTDLGYSLVLMAILHKDDSFDEAEQELNKQDHSGYSRSLVLDTLSEFHPKGKDFVRHVTH